MFRANDRLLGNYWLVNAPHEFGEHDAVLLRTRLADGLTLLPAFHFTGRRHRVARSGGM